MNRAKLLEACERVEGNAWMMRRFLHDPEVGASEAAIEIVGRVGIIEAKLAEIRKALVSEPDNVHVLGNRGDAA